MWFFKKKKEEQPKPAQPMPYTPQERVFIPPITPEDAHRRLSAEGEQIQVVDVRELWEWQTGHIEGASHIPLGALPSQLHTLDKSRDLIVVCHSGGRSAHATKLLQDKGFTKALNMVGGMSEWEMMNYPVVREETSA